MTTNSLIIHGDIVFAPELGKLKCVKDGYVVSKDGISKGVYNELSDVPLEYKEYPVIEGKYCRGNKIL